MATTRPSPTMPCTLYEGDFSSGDSVRNEDIQAIAKKLGIVNQDDFHSVRFQVDRHKLQKMLKIQSDIQGISLAESYFEKIMKTTETYISWPRKIQVDTKSKKDPFVDVFGKPDDINWAKGLILTTFDTKGASLKLKLAISSNDHLFIVGRGNNNVNRIMAETDTKIQFPDINSRNSVKKNNHVTIYGSPEAVEKARISLRLSSPLLMSFEVPICQPIPAIDRVQDMFNVQVMLTLKQNTFLILVKGAARRADTVKEATRVLINSMSRKIATRTLVSIQLEISPQFQDAVKGEDNANLLTIMENTKTKIFFPDLSMRGNLKEKSQVTIIGTIDAVCEARQELVNILPIELTFDIPGENQNNATEIMNLGTNCGVRITLTQKELDSAMAVTIRGVEKRISKIYEAHYDIVQLRSTLLAQKEIPKAFYLLEGAYQRVMNSLVNRYVESIVERTDSMDIGYTNGAAQVIPNGEQISNQSNFNSGYNHAMQSNTLLEQFGSTYTEQEHTQATYSPDSGHSSQFIYQPEPQSNDWTLLGVEGREAIRQINLGGAESGPQDLTYLNQHIGFRDAEVGAKGDACPRQHSALNFNQPEAVQYLPSSSNSSPHFTHFTEPGDKTRTFNGWDYQFVFP